MLADYEAASSRPVSPRKVNAGLPTMIRRCFAVARRDSALRRIATLQRWASNSRNWRCASSRYTSEFVGNGARNDTAARENTRASCRHWAGVPEVTGMTIAGNPLYAGTVMCFWALPSPDDPPHPPSRRRDRSHAVEDLLTSSKVSVAARRPGDPTPEEAIRRHLPGGRARDHAVSAGSLVRVDSPRKCGTSTTSTRR